MKIKILCAQICILLISLFAQGKDHDSLFPTPDILKGNVAFWKKIYSEVSLSEGLIHDRDYPMVIFEKVKGDGSSAAIKKRKEKISASLKIINTQPKSSWTEQENQIFELYKINADTTVLSGASERVRFQQGQTERFKQGLQRSGLYMDTIRSIFQQYGIPQRLTYLPHVESSFNAEAYSKVGAAGLWQFMRGTGKLYGMQIDYTIDERRDPVLSTIAAAKYLSSSYRELKSWPLAITSYNHGVYGIKRAVAQTGSSDLGYIIQNYSSKSFKFASSNFYGCFLAASDLAENHISNFPDIKMYSPVKYTDFTLSHYIHPAIICKYFNISQETFSSLNPAIRPVIFKQNKMLPKGFVVHLPAGLSSENIYALAKKIPDSLKAAKPERPKYYRVNKGDNLYSIASRLGISINDLLVENNISKRNIIRAGQVLRIPGKTEHKTEAVALLNTSKNSIAATTTNDIASETDTTATEAIAEIAQAEAQSALPPEEKIETKDISVMISKPVTPRTVPKAIVSSKEKVIPVIPPPVEEVSDSLKEVALSPAIDNTEVSATSKPSLAPEFDVSLYNLDLVLSSVGNSAELRVSIDETIGHYADWLKIPTWRIRKLNDMRNSDIRANNKLRIPIDRQDALETFAAARLEYHMAIEEDFYAQYMVTDVKPLIIKRGQTLWDLCNEGDNPLPLWLFKKYNTQIDLSKLMPGTTVWIPIIGENTGLTQINSLVNPDTNQKTLTPIRNRSQRLKVVP